MSARSTRMRGLMLALCATASIAVVPAAQAAGCATASHPGGDWPMLNRTLANDRSQPAETTIANTDVPTLAAAWTFSPGDAGGVGTIQSTPVIAEGCVYITTSSGWIFALNADNGELVWKTDISETVAGVCCGGTLFAPSVSDGVLYINVSKNAGTSSDKNGPFVAALDAHTGVVIWESVNVAAENGAYTNSSSVLYDGMVFIGISNPENGFHEIGGYAFVDADDGAIIKRGFTVPDDQRAKGYAGGSIWATAAVNTATGYGFAGSGQPSDWEGNESERVNAILKIDFARARDAAGGPILGSEQITNPRFGEIVDSRKGTWDDTPYIDVDFAASPTLYKDALGQDMVVEYQKSGWMHSAYQRDMSAGWSIPIAPFGTALGNYASTSTDGTNIFGAGTYPGQIASLSGTSGVPNWIQPAPTGFGANPTTYANGVVYHATHLGILDAFDAATGVPLLSRPMTLDTGSLCTNAGGGVSVARNTVYAVCGDSGLSAAIGPNDDPSGWLIAYKAA